MVPFLQTGRSQISTIVTGQSSKPSFPCTLGLAITAFRSQWTLPLSRLRALPCFASPRATFLRSFSTGERSLSVWTPRCLPWDRMMMLMAISLQTIPILLLLLLIIPIQTQHTAFLKIAAFNTRSPFIGSNPRSSSRSNQIPPWRSQSPITSI